ncbi:Pol polyprotein [Gossypium australe]|uniref:Pol polyprotein n=1 Tax=Gossypium australe TaxID=47621 RepID=A0A5B6UXK0_9ROSI|nr:Pol polyprotein [Gossypium australe]
MLGNVSKRNEMPLTNILKVEYILVVIDYVSKWVEVESYPSNDAKKNIFTGFETPKAITSDEGSHFVNKWLKWLLDKYDVKHKVATAYHPQTNSQAEFANK